MLQEEEFKKKIAMRNKTTAASNPEKAALLAQMAAGPHTSPLLTSP